MHKTTFLALMDFLVRLGKFPIITSPVLSLCLTLCDLRLQVFIFSPLAVCTLLCFAFGFLFSYPLGVFSQLYISMFATVLRCPSFNPALFQLGCPCPHLFSCMFSFFNIFIQTMFTNACTVINPMACIFQCFHHIVMNVPLSPFCTIISNNLLRSLEHSTYNP